MLTEQWSQEEEVVGMEQDHASIREIPGYKLILKSVIKSQIQLLVQQLSDFGDEECCILTACLSDGTLGQLGSNFGKNFLDSRGELKSQFLAYCLTSHYTGQVAEVPGLSSNLTSKNVSSKLSGKSFSGQRNCPYNRPSSSSSSRKTDQLTDTPEMLLDKDSKSSLIDTVFKGIGNHVNQSVITKEVENLDTVCENQSVYEKTETGNLSSLNCNNDQYASEDNQSSSNDVIVKREPADQDFCASYLDDSNSWGPVSSEMSGPSSNMGQEIYGNQSIKLKPEGAVTHEKGNHSIPSNHFGYFTLTESELNCANRKENPFQKRFKCKICGKLFSKKFDVKRHQTIHTGERFSCLKCPKSFTQKAQLKAHERFHLYQERLTEINKS